ncbi:uncharacterized protein [Spinacia oleracea]|uniref:Uncharacterized protein isoform X3 n=1 Tax=Spinacia oleracea TaxID=3562 RepID=A0ABM3QLP5_SPIOL|nr:uncharacterized protein LOC110793798 isoform X3 [Spinacia oleracea]
MSGGDVGRLSSDDLQLVCGDAVYWSFLFMIYLLYRLHGGFQGILFPNVKNLIERCLQLHMSKKEAIDVLLREANVMPSITALLWQRLEEENQEFFEVYHIRLALTEQIKKFNELLKAQASLMGNIQSTGVTTMPVSNGTTVAQYQQNAGCYAIDQTGPSMRQESLQPSVGPNLHNSYTNGVSPLQTPFDLSTPSRTIDCHPNTLHVQNTNSLRLVQGLNGGMVKSESGYPSDSSVFFNADPHLGEAHRSMEEASITNFGGMEASSQPMNGTLLGVNGSFGQLGINKYFSLPELVAYPNTLENYTNSSFMTSETENFLDSQDRGDIAG